MRYGMKLSTGDISRTRPENMLVHPDFPMWNTDVVADPSHFGLVRCQINSIGASVRLPVHTVTHRYGGVPSFITAWYVPDTISPFSSTTNGTGVLDISNSDSQSLVVTAESDDVGFGIYAENTSGSAMTDIYFEMRYYIFANQFDN